MKTKILALLILFPPLAALAAYQDSFGPSRLDTVSVECPQDTAGPCLVSVQRVRSPTSTALAEATSAGLAAPIPHPEPVVRRSATRAQLAAFLSATSPVP